MSTVVLAIAALIAYGVSQSSVLIVVGAVTIGLIFLHILRRSLTEVEHDERTIIIRNKAASTTLAIITVAMATIGLSLVFMSGQGRGDYEQIGYLLAYQANFILVINALLNYYYKNKFGG